MKLPVAALAALALLLSPRSLAAQKPKSPVRPARADIALFRVEPLGLDAERAARLEALFRLELERMAGAPLPGRGAVENAAASDASLRGCTGEPECLSKLGKKLGVKKIVTGNVGELGESYVLNLKLVDVTTGAEVRRVSEPLRGSPDELIEAMRVAAYRLVAPERLLGSVTILSDVRGAEVLLDGKSRGKTPLAQPIPAIPLGNHKIRIVAPGYSDFLGEVEVRFEKSTQVVVHLVRAGEAAYDPNRPRPAPIPWYSSNWTWLGVGVGAVVVGLLVGLSIAGDHVVDCGAGACP